MFELRLVLILVLNGELLFVSNFVLVVVYIEFDVGIVICVGLDSLHCWCD